MYSISKIQYLDPGHFLKSPAVEMSRHRKNSNATMETVKLGIVGLGTMGAIHAQSVLEGSIPRCELTAVCDPKAERLNQFPSVKGYVSRGRLSALLGNGRCLDCHAALLAYRHRDKSAGSRARMCWWKNRSPSINRMPNV